MSQLSRKAINPSATRSRTIAERSNAPAVRSAIASTSIVTSRSAKTGSVRYSPLDRLTQTRCILPLGQRALRESNISYAIARMWGKGA